MVMRGIYIHTHMFVRNFVHHRHRNVGGAVEIDRGRARSTVAAVADYTNIWNDVLVGNIFECLSGHHAGWCAVLIFTVGKAAGFRMSFPFVFSPVVSPNKLRPLLWWSLFSLLSHYCMCRNHRRNCFAPNHLHEPVDRHLHCVCGQNKRIQPTELPDVPLSIYSLWPIPLIYWVYTFRLCN